MLIYKASNSAIVLCPRCYLLMLSIILERVSTLFFIVQKMIFYQRPICVSMLVCVTYISFTVFPRKMFWFLKNIQGKLPSLR